MGDGVVEWVMVHPSHTHPSHTPPSHTPTRHTATPHTSSPGPALIVASWPTPGLPVDTAAKESFEAIQVLLLLLLLLLLLWVCVMCDDDDDAVSMSALTIYTLSLSLILSLSHTHTHSLSLSLPHTVSHIHTYPPPQAAVRSVRNARAEYNVEPGRRIAATVVVADPQLQTAFETEQDVIASLAKLDAEQLEVRMCCCGGCACCAKFWVYERGDAQQRVCFINRKHTLSTTTHVEQNTTKTHTQARVLQSVLQRLLQTKAATHLCPPPSPTTPHPGHLTTTSKRRRGLH